MPQHEAEVENRNTMGGPGWGHVPPGENFVHFKDKFINLQHFESLKSVVKNK